MGSERFWRWMWLIAVWHNIIGGMGVIVLGDWLYAREGLPTPVPGVYYFRWGYLILVFGLVYYLVYRNLYRSRDLVIVGIVGKTVSATADLYYLAAEEGVARIFWIPVFTDYAFVVLFWLFLRWVAQQRPLPQPSPAATV